MLDKIINLKLSKQGLQLLYWKINKERAPLIVVATLDTNKAKSIHFNLRSVLEKYFSEIHEDKDVDKDIDNGIDINLFKKQ